MGELADQIISGESCQYCIKPFETGEKIYQETRKSKYQLIGKYNKPLGFPCSCEDCLEPGEILTNKLK